jgi:hypothetical protein
LQLAWAAGLPGQIGTGWAAVLVFRIPGKRQHAPGSVDRPFSTLLFAA